MIRLWAAASALLLLVAACSMAAVEAHAQGKGGGGGKGPSTSQSREYYETLGQVQVNLVPIYPAHARCPQISSFFGSGARYDGSTRVNDHQGFHNGMDISAPDGTPLLAIADGEVVHAGTGGMLVGNYVWLRHTPQDTGLPIHLFTRYQHLEKASPLQVGARVKMGEVVGPAGRTGTIGGYFGSAGYSHLHLLVFAADTADFSIRDAVVVADVNRRYLDPLAIYMNPQTPFDNHMLKDLPAAGKQVSIPFQFSDGTREPAQTRVIWPLACQRPV
jgi:murein DD-endopeptidase MepM/ murein hydrolase activator NlpD